MSDAARQLLELDRQARRAAQTRFDAPLVVEAGAGTGKTTALVTRVLGWCLGPGWEEAAARLGTPDDAERVAAGVLDGVVAITFTEAAAAEMASRVASSLALLAAGRGGELRGLEVELLDAGAATSAVHRARSLLGAVDRLTVETIHAFCRRILARHPLEAGLHPDLVVDADLHLTEEIIVEVVEEAVRTAYAARSTPPLGRLAAHGHGPAEVVDHLRKLIEGGVPAAALEVDPFALGALAAIVDDLRGALQELLESGGELLATAARSSRAIETVDAVRRSLPLLDPPPTDAPALAVCLGALRELWPEPNLERLKSWSRGRFNNAEREAVGDHGEMAGGAAGRLRGQLRRLVEVDPLLLDLARRSLAPLLSEVERISRSRGVVTFPALLWLARDLLADNRRIRRDERQRIRQLLVDEFQDTDPLQCDVVRLLALDGPAGDRPGLFVVGDPKQSIFGWRSADLGAYHTFLQGILEAGGERLLLTRNFRSAQSLLDDVDRSVEPLMVFEEGFQPAYQRLAADPGNPAGCQPPVEIWISWPAGADGRLESARTDRGENATRLEAHHLARDLLRTHRELGVPWREMAVLLRALTGVETYLEELRDAGVPFVVTRDRHYYRRKEVMDAAALVLAVADPLDLLSLVGFLRSTAGGLPDAALIPLWNGGFPELAISIRGPASPALDRARELLGEVAAVLPEVPGGDRIRGWELAAGDALAAIAELRSSFRDDPMDHFVRRLRRRTLVEVGEAARYQGRFRLANLERFFRRLEQALCERGNDVGAILRTVRRSLDEAPDHPEALPKDVGEAAVQVLSIHKAKGLEFEHVWAVDLHHETRAEDDLKWDPQTPGEYRLFGVPTPGYHRLSERRQRVESRERVRTLYVAMTRAKQRLVLVGHWPAQAGTVDVERCTTLADLLACRPDQPPDLASLAAECRAAGRSTVEREGTRWRFLALDREPPAPTRREHPEAPYTVSAVARAVDTLGERRLAAAQRMLRPLSATASAGSEHKLRALFEEASEAEERETPQGLPRDLALAAGTVVHRALETWDPEADADNELERQLARTGARLSGLVEAQRLEDAAVRVEDLLRRFAKGPLLARLRTLAPGLLARELDLVAPAPAAADGVSAVACVTGAIDLLTRDPDGGYLIVDYKTDAVEGDADLAARATAYEPQMGVYRRAVEEALRLDGPPAVELWFLWTGSVWRTP